MCIQNGQRLINSVRLYRINSTRFKNLNSLLSSFICRCVVFCSVPLLCPSAPQHSAFPPHLPCISLVSPAPVLSRLLRSSPSPVSLRRSLPPAPRPLISSCFLLCPCRVVCSVCLIPFPSVYFGRVFRGGSAGPPFPAILCHLLLPAWRVCTTDSKMCCVTSGNIVRFKFRDDVFRAYCYGTSNWPKHRRRGAK